ncbi:MAG: TrkA family potassium uptake protein [Solobacterium sp.]|nr:TrkA family potassium uptake protein [Solobacterium sp.]
MARKSVAVLGLGKYGLSLAKSLYEMGVDVLGADMDPDRVKEAAGCTTAAVCADLSVEDEVLALELSNMDIVVTAMGENLTSSIMCVVIAKEQDVPLIVAKCSNKRMASILTKVGADKTIIPEEEEGIRSARILANDNMLDYFQIGSNLSMVEMRPKDQWIGKTLTELHLRKTHNLNVVAVKEEGGQWELADPENPFTTTMKLLIVLESDDLGRLE